MITAAARHPKIAEQDVRLMPFDELEGLVAVFRERGFVAPSSQDFTPIVLGDDIIVSYKNSVFASHG